MRRPGAPTRTTRRPRWTFVWLAGALALLWPPLALVAPRVHAPDSPAREPSATTEHEPPPAVALVPPRAPVAARPERNALPTGTTISVAASAAPEEGARATTEPGPAPELARLEIRVTSGGRPASGAALELAHAASERPTRHSTDAGGELALALRPGRVRVVAFEREACAAPVSCALVAGETARLELELEPAFPVAGRVIDAHTGAPLAGVEVALWTFAELDTVTTAADGTFLHPRFPARSPAQQLAARARGYGVAVRYLRLGAEGAWTLAGRTADEVNVRGTGTPWVELALVREQRVRGRVLDERGDPLAGAELVAEGFFHAMASVATRDRATATSATDGRFELSGLRSDIGHSLVASAPGRATLALELPAEAGELDVGDLCLARESVLAGAVIDADGLPVADAEVVLRLSEVDELAPPAGVLDVGARLSGREWRARTTSDGAFAFTGLAARPLVLSVEHLDLAAADIELVPRSDGSFATPCVTLWPRGLTVAERAPRPR
jgi:protocatechuate 3,4-dioxygenase beta subunit